MSTEDVAKRVREKLADLAASVAVEGADIVAITAAPEVLPDIASRLSELGFDHVKSVTGVDELDTNKIRVVYHVASFKPKLARVMVALKTDVERENSTLPSLIEIWPSAEYPERETFDLLGVSFTGHPRLERLLLPQDYADIPPLRKEFKLKEARIRVE